MKSNELRISNYIYVKGSDFGKIGYVVGITPAFIEVRINGVYQSFSIDDIEPIELTSGILEMAGFRENAVGILAIEANDMATHLELTQVDEKYFPTIDQLQDIGMPQNVALNYIQYVHQLQNLFFCLTGEELPLTL